MLLISASTDNMSEVICAFDYVNEKYYIFYNSAKTFKEENAQAFFSLIKGYEILKELPTETNLNEIHKNYPEFFI